MEPVEQAAGATAHTSSHKSARIERIDEDAWATLYRTESRAFPKPKSGRIAVKVINHHGDEATRVFRVP